MEQRSKWRADGAFSWFALLLLPLVLLLGLEGLLAHPSALDTIELSAAEP